MIMRSPTYPEDDGGHPYDHSGARLPGPASYPAPRSSRPTSSCAASIRRAPATAATPSSGARLSSAVWRSCVRGSHGRVAQTSNDRYPDHAAAQAHVKARRHRRQRHGYRIVGWPSRRWRDAANRAEAGPVDAGISVILQLLDMVQWTLGAA